MILSPPIVMYLYDITNARDKYRSYVYNKIMDTIIIGHCIAA